MNVATAMKNTLDPKYIPALIQAFSGNSKSEKWPTSLILEEKREIESKKKKEK
jgi:hypothetical protein